ncbi:MAG: secretin and TonB N-terminal domain-containing protein [Fidelibacterota bacterium]
MIKKILFILIALGFPYLSAKEVDRITTFDSDTEMGVTIILSEEVKFEERVSQAPPVLRLVFPNTTFRQEKYTKQISLPPLYRIDAKEVPRRDFPETVVTLYFTYLPEYTIESEAGLMIRVSWAPKEEELKQRTRARRLSTFETTVSLNFKEAELIDILRLLQVQNNLNIIAGEDVTGKVTVSLNDVSLGTALDAILKVNGYDWFMQENIIVIKPIDQEMTGELETRLYKLEYVDATAVSAALTNILTTKGKVQVFSPVLKGGGGVGGGGLTGGTTGGGGGAAGGLLGGLTGAGAGGGAAATTGGGVTGGGGGLAGGGTMSHLLVTDTHSNFNRIEEVIHQLDQQIPQINIAVKFIETKLSVDERLGINWNMRASLSGPTAPSGTDVSPTTVELGWLNKDLRLATLSIPAFNSILEILSSDNDSRIVQEPQVSTLDNTLATVTTGTSYPILVPQPVTATGQQTATFQEEQINVTLNVLPRINEDTYISMNINAVVQALIGFAGPDADRPIVSERSTTTQVMVGDGETLLIGGLIFDQFIETESSVPFLGKIPLIKSLFTHKSTSTEQRELLIFITPNIIRM